MSYIGTPPSNAFTSLLKQDFSTSATTGYTLDHAVNNANDIALFINFVRQEPTAGYAASGTTLTLTSATASSDDMYCVYLGQALQTVNPPNASVGTSQLVDGAVTSAKLASGVGGKVLQVVQTVKTDTFSSSSTSYTDITGMSVAITPSSSSNKILILCHLGILGTTGSGTSASVQLLRGSTVIGNGTPASSRLGSIYRTAGGVNGDHNNGGSFQFLDSPSTTSATTYKLQGISQTSFNFTVNKSGSDADSALSYGTRTSSTLTAMEISA